jgi:hypothetical protein
MRLPVGLPLVALALALGCLATPAPAPKDNSDAQAPQAAFRQPTPTEVFHLRTECAQLAQKIMDENLIGSALTQTIVSRYDPRSNRCYAQLSVLGPEAGPSTGYVNNVLYDAQTRDMLAFATQEKDGRRKAYVFTWIESAAPKGKPTTYEQTLDYINNLMADDRKQ